jgi:predicted PhzF superfamily epimerase YddE/YHI9
MVNNFPTYILDAFTGTRFTGNQAAVCLIKEVFNILIKQLVVLQLNLQKLSDAIYQKIGAEFNLSETAFPIPLDTDDFKTGK